MKIKLEGGETVSATRYRAKRGSGVGATLLLGHGAGAGQNSEFMVRFADGLAARGLEIWTFNFLYSELGRPAPDRADRLEACYRAAIAAVRKRPETGRLFIGGKSMGGRIASQVAAGGVEGIAGLVFLGYPLHPPGQPEWLRAEHLPLIRKPMLFVQGERDPFGTPAELQPILKKLKPTPSLYAIAGGDHSFKAAKKFGASQEQIYAAVQDEIATWIKTV